jgi:hypothetical protein
LCGLVEDIITTLSKLAGLRVIACNSSFVYKGRSVDIREAAKQLGVRHVLEGSVRKSGNRIRITAQLIDAKNGTHVWAERYDRAMDDIFVIQDEITLVLATDPWHKPDDPAENANGSRTGIVEPSDRNTTLNSRLASVRKQSGFALPIGPHRQKRQSDIVELRHDRHVGRAPLSDSAARGIAANELTSAARARGRAGRVRRGLGQAPCRPPSCRQRSGCLS